MNRIYQGRVSKVEISTGNKENPWQPFDTNPEKARKKWEDALWRHHKLFQDAVNHSLAAFAVMARECPPNSLPAKFRTTIAGMWFEYKGRQGEWKRPFGRVCQLVTGNPNCSFEEFEKRLLAQAGCKSTQSQHALAISALTERMVTGSVEKDEKPGDCWRDLIEFSATFTNQAGRVEERQQRISAQVVAHRIASDSISKLKLEEVFLFKATPGAGKMWGVKKTAAELRQRFDLLATPNAQIAARRTEFDSWMQSKAKSLSLPGPGGKTQAPFDAALLFHLLEWPELRAAFTQLTSKLREEELPVITADSSKAVRVDGKPVFSAFSNLAIVQDGKPKQFAWGPLDKAAGIEALTKYQQFCRDCREQDNERTQLSARKLDFETRGAPQKSDGSERIPGFESDSRKMLVEKLVAQLGGERRDENDNPLPYRIRRNTLKAWKKLRATWLELSQNSDPSEATLNDVRRKLQKSKKDSFGSAELFILLAKPEYKPIWKDSPTEKWQAEDLLEAWAAYVETCEDLQRTERKINFTPAHEIHSPRYFCWSETNKHKHMPWQRGNAFQVECYIPVSDFGSAKASLQKVQIHFFAPRLLRDSLRFHGESLKHPDASWLPAAYRARPELVAAAKEQTFAGTSVRLSPGYDSKQNFRVLLDFAVEIQSKEIQRLWSSWRPLGKNFGHGMKDDDDVYRFVAWPKPGKEKNWTSRHEFECLSADMGLRRPAAWAILRAQSEATARARKIGTANGKDWFARPTAMGVLRLPGEDAQVFRKPNKQEREGGGFDPAKTHEEFWGSSGRPALPFESEYAWKLLKLVETQTNYSIANLPNDWKARLSYPEQNDELVRALRYLRSRIRMFHRWGWLLLQEDRKTDTLSDIADANVSSEWKAWAKDGDVKKLYGALETDAQHLTGVLQDHLIVVINRAMLSPKRNFRWKDSDGWLSLEEVEDKSRKKIDCVGQRGISLKRIQQLLDLRELCQSLNKLVRREFGKPTRVERGVETPESCRQILDLLEELRDQRVNQIANGLFCLALGVRRVPRTLITLAERLKIKVADPEHPTKQELEQIEAQCREQDLHGIYESIPKRRPVDFIVLEELEGFRMSSVRSRRDNRNLARWCHRQIVKKLEELCQPLQIPILKVAAEDTSRFCSRTGAPGFRAVEVRCDDERLSRWTEAFADSTQAKDALDIFEWLKLANAGVTDRKLERTLLAPQFLGPKFVALAKAESDSSKKPPIVDNADVGAAITIGFRALGNRYTEWHIYPKRWLNGILSKKSVPKKSSKTSANSTQAKAEEPYYADFSQSLGGVQSNEFPAPILPARGFWELVEKQSWLRCREINAARMRYWGFNDDVPMHFV